MDRVRALRGWAPGEFQLNVSFDSGGILVKGMDDLALPGGNYNVRLEIADLRALGGRLKVDIDDDEQVTLRVEVAEDPRNIELTTPFASFDPEINRALAAAESQLDGLTVENWLGSAAPRPSRKACLLNVMAKLRTAPDKKTPLMNLVDFVFWAEADRVYARVQKGVY